MLCPACGYTNPANAKFCLQCGARLALACAACGVELPADARFCLQCGQPVAATGASERALPTPDTYTPSFLAERILASRGSLEGERKQVTVVFADLKGSMELLAARDPEEARTILDGVLERMMEAVHRYEGTVNQTMGDGIMALFGAPIAHEDHAVRACYAALRMQGAVRDYAQELQRTGGLFVQIRVGLNSGEVVVRSIGSDLRMDYSAVGSTTHLAARMEQTAAPGSILLAPETLALAEGYIQVRPIGPVPVQGLDRPIEVFELTGVGQARTRLQAAAARGLTRFVGRDAEVDALRGALERAGAGHGQVVAVVGDPGVGKSRLVYELVHSHRTHGWLVLEAGSVSYGRATPYLPVTDLLKAYFRTEPQDNERRIRERVAGKVLTLDEALRRSLPAYLTLLDVPVEDADWQALEPAQRRRQTLDGVRHLLLRESQVQPLLLVFEDLHWIDPETQALLDSLVESIPSARILLLVNYRPEYAHGWGSKTYYGQVRLDPLGPESADELLRWLMGEDPSLAAVKSRFVERTEGNPFFLEESVRTLVETGVLGGDRGSYRLLRRFAVGQVPATVQAMLAARVDRLPPEQKRLLQSAAVIGKDVPYALLRAIADVGDGDWGLGVGGLTTGPTRAPTSQLLQGQLAQLQAAEFLYEASLFPELEYTFKHALTHEVAYGSLLQERRRALHGQILEAIERLYAGRLADHVEQLAQHAMRAERWDRAVAYLQDASEKAAARSAYAEAVRLLEQALEALRQAQGEREDPATRCDLLLALGQALMPAGEPQRVAEEVAPQALALAEAIGDGERAGRACSLALQALNRYGAGSISAAPVFQQWAEGADRYAGPDTRGRVDADLALSSVEIAAGRWAKARGLTERALVTARQLNDPAALFAVAAALVQPWWDPRHQAEQIAIVEELTTWSRDGGRVRDLAISLQQSYAIYLRDGRRDRAEWVQQDLERLAARTGDPLPTLMVTFTQAAGAILDGDLEAAVTQAARVVAQGAELGLALRGRQFGSLLATKPLVYLGRVSEALAMRAEFREAASSRPSAEPFGGETLLNAYVGRTPAATSKLREWIDAMPAPSRVNEVPANALASLLEAAVLVEDRVAARALAERLQGVVAVHSSGLLENVARQLGAAAILLGDREATRAHYQRSLEWATAIRHRPEIALTRLAVAELLLDEAVGSQRSAVSDGGGEADKLRAEGLEHLEFAIAELRAMKMQPALERALKVKELQTA